MAQQEQTLKNHTRYDPLFHFFLAPIAVLMVIATIVLFVRAPDWESGAHILVALWAFLLTLKVRLYALKNQDRIIRLEERIRLKELAPASFAPRIAELSVNQLIGLRFASDGEVVELAEKARAGNWNLKQIKAAIRNWRPDSWRA